MAAKMGNGHADAQKASVERFREFLRLKTVSGLGPTGPYNEAAAWIASFAERVGIPHEIVTIVPNKPIVLLTWKGSEPELPAILLNSHYDVVPVMEEFWDVDPFAAERSEDGKIYGRGAQDMKCVCIQYLEAVARLKAEGFVPRRNVYLSFVPDEEIGGVDGMKRFTESETWQRIQPIGFALDEGLANPGNAFTVFYGERTPWWFMVKASGNTGHGSRFIENTAVSKLIAVCNKALEFRQQQESALGHHGGCSHAQAKKLGDVTTLNLTMLRAGVTSDNGETWALNVVPTSAEAGFDVRISPSMETHEFKELLNRWCEEEGVTWSFAPWISPLDEHYLTSLDREKNPWWGIFLDTCKGFGVDVQPEIFPAATDSRFIRQMKIPALGFSPMRNTPVLLHDHNEYLHEDVFLEGVDIMQSLIQAFATADRLPTEK